MDTIHTNSFTPVVDSTPVIDSTPVVDSTSDVPADVLDETETETEPIYARVVDMTTIPRQKLTDISKKIAQIDTQHKKHCKPVRVKITHLQNALEKLVAQYEGITSEIYVSRVNTNLRVSSSRRVISDSISSLKAEREKIVDEITNKSRIRNKDPNFDVPHIKQLDKRIEDSQSKLLLPEITIPFPFIWKWTTLCNASLYPGFIRYYQSTKSTINTEIEELESSMYFRPSAKKAYDALVAEQSLIQSVVDEDEWIDAYKAYAKNKGLWIEDGDDIFAICNEYHVQTYIDHTEFNCPLNCYFTESNYDECHGHVIFLGHNRCTGGTKVYIKPYVSMKIGAIADHPSSYVQIERK